MSRKQAATLRTLRNNTQAFIKKCGGLSRAADAILSSPGCRQRNADIRETTVQGVGYEDAMQHLDTDSIYMEYTDHRADPLAILIHQEEAAAEPQLPRIGGRLGCILDLAGRGKDEEQIAEALGLGKKRIQQILSDPTLGEQVELASRQPELPFF